MENRSIENRKIFYTCLIAGVALAATWLVEVFIPFRPHWIFATDVEMDFFTVLESAKRQGQIAIGYRIMSKQFEKDLSYGVVVNPVKTNKVTFSPGDKIIVFSED